jgi:cytochrome c-type biogenesis protein
MLNETVSYPAALMAGLLSFFSPCVLPLLPAYFSFISGYSAEELTKSLAAKIRVKVFIATIVFVSGFSFVFIFLGASATYIGGFIGRYNDAIRIAGGIVIIIFGIHLMGVIRIQALEFEKRIHLNKKPLHFGGTFIVGMAFGAGWSPCIGPLLGSILIIAGNQETIMQGVILLIIYSIGMAAPFVLLSLFVGYLLIFIKKATRTTKYINAFAGIILICMGILLLTNKLYLLYTP